VTAGRGSSARQPEKSKGSFNRPRLRRAPGAGCWTTFLPGLRSNLSHVPPPRNRKIVEGTAFDRPRLAIAQAGAGAVATTVLHPGRLAARWGSSVENPLAHTRRLRTGNGSNPVDSPPAQNARRGGERGWCTPGQPPSAYRAARARQAPAKTEDPAGAPAPGPPYGKWRRAKLAGLARQTLNLQAVFRRQPRASNHKQNPCGLRVFSSTTSA